MDHESLTAIRLAAVDYFTRSKSAERCRSYFLNPDANEAEGWSDLVALGWPGMLAPESVGGLDLDLTTAAAIFHAAGEHVAPEPLLAVAGLSALLLAKLQTPAANALLEELVAGRQLPALAWQERIGDLSVEPSLLACEFRPAESSVHLQGKRIMVLPGSAATGWLVPVQANAEPLLLWVPRGTAGVSESLTRLVDGSESATVCFDKVSLPATAILAQGAAAHEALRYTLAQGLVLQAAELLGAGWAMYEQTLVYLRTRTQFGKVIGAFQALQHRAVDMFIHLEVARSALDEVLAIASDPAGVAIERLEAEASRINARCTAAALQASRSAVQLHGAIGYTQECGLSIYYKRTLKLSAWLGNVTAHQRRYAALSEVGPHTDEAVNWDGEFPRSADWSTMSEAEFRRMVRAFLQQRYPENLRYLSHRARWSEMRDWYLVLSAQGWIAPGWPQSHGGMGLPADKMIAWIEELEQHGVARAPDQGIIMIGPLLIQHGTPEQQQRFLPGILSGDYIWCQGYSEPNAGSDLASVRTEAVQARDADGDHFVVNGQKIWTTLAQDASHIFMLVRTDRDAKKQEGISFVLCDLATPGITIRPIYTLAGEPEFCEVFFDNVRVPAENLVGKLHGGWTIAKALLGFERLFVGSPKQPQYALGQLARLAQSRQLFADPVFAQRYTALSLDVADLCAAYTGFANIVKAGKPLPASVSLLKIWASETYHRIGALLVEASEEQGAVAGDHDLEGQPFNALSSLIGSTSAMIYGGTNEIQRNILVRQVLDLPS
ncbi:acyl-CoA dehydrogenase [Alcaligenaceae bacterium]|nr:acyl-CoA dehydrogenase [Alcaligenaceae bacterium]